MNDFGLPPFLGVPMLVFLFYVASNYIIGNFSKGEYIYLFLGFFLLIHLDDLHKVNFLKTCFKGFHFYIIKSIENSIYTFPFAIICFINGKYLTGFIFILMGILFSFFTLKKSIQLTIPTPFGKHPFEFTSGFRKQILVFLFAYLFLFISSRVDNFNLIVFSLLIVLLNCSLFYLKPEPKYFIWIYNTSSEEFLKKKIKVLVFNLIILLLPHITFTVCFYTDKLFLLFIFQILWSLNVILMLLIKYASYPSDTNLTQIIILFMSFTFPPFTLFFIYIYYKKSIKNLNQILNDSN
jgi:hypothetical protein